MLLLWAPAALAQDAEFETNSKDGTIVFWETEEQLVPADDDTAVDVYKRNGATGEIKLVSGGDEDVNAFFEGASKDGRIAFFRTTEALLGADGDTTNDVYKFKSGEIKLVSGGSLEVPADFAGASRDGTIAFFETGEDLVGAPLDAAVDVYKFKSGEIKLISGGDENGLDATFRGASNDGKIAFWETAESLLSADGDTATDVYKRKGTDEIKLVSDGEEDVDAFFAGASTDGTRVFFETDEQLLGADGDTSTDVYKFKSGEIKLISSGDADEFVEFQGASNDGAIAFFTTDEQLADDDTDTSRDVYKRKGSDEIKLVSGGSENENADFEGASKDGTIAFFDTDEQLVDDDDDMTSDVYRFKASEIKLISDGDEEEGATFRGSSADGGTVFFNSAEQLVESDGDDDLDVYRFKSGEIKLISGGSEDEPAFFEGASNDGRIAFFETSEPLVGADGDDDFDIYKRKGTGQIKLISG